jgi:hypothetical protein
VVIAAALEAASREELSREPLTRPEPASGLAEAAGLVLPTPSVVVVPTWSDGSGTLSFSRSRDGLAAAGA